MFFGLYGESLMGTILNEHEVLHKSIVEKLNVLNIFLLFLRKMASDVVAEIGGIEVGVGWVSARSARPASVPRDILSEVQ